MELKPKVIARSGIDTLVNRLRFRHLQMVIVLTEAGSLRAAAGRLHISQPAISKSLTDLEAAFGWPLFRRSTRGLEPTAEGLTVAAAARALISDLDYWRQEAARRSRSEVAVLRLGAPPGVMQTRVPALIERLSALAEPVRLELTEARVRTLFEDLRAERLDALLSSVHSSVIATPESRALRFEFVYQELQAVVCSPRHRLAGVARMAWKDLRDEPWILPDTGSFVRQAVVDAFIRAGLTAPVPAIQSFHPSANLALVRAGLGLSVVPHDYVARLPDVVELNVHPALQAVPIGLVYRAAKGRRPAIEALQAAAAALV